MTNNTSVERLEISLEDFLSINPFLSKWDYRFLRIAVETGSWSKDPNKKVGCVFVKDGKRDVAKGYNGFPGSLSDDLNRLRDPAFKDKVILHAEKNAIIYAAKFGISPQGCTAYITYHPCAACASMLIEAGIAKIICPSPFSASKKWLPDFKLSSDILHEAKIPVLYYNIIK